MNNIMIHPYPATLVAREFFNLNHRKNELGNFRPIHIILLSYIANGWAYPSFNRRLIKEDVEAWKYGPMYSGLLDKFRKCSENFESAACMVPYDSEEQYYRRKHGKYMKLDDDSKELVKVIYDAYKDHTEGQLVTSLMMKGSPWDRFIPWPWRSNVISQKTIKDYYMKEHNDNQ